MELTQTAYVEAGGKVEVHFPDLQTGQRVEVRVLTDEAKPKQVPVFGRLKGRITILDNFDDPLPEFENYLG